MFMTFLFAIHFSLSLRWCCPEGGLSMLMRVFPPKRAGGSPVTGLITTRSRNLRKVLVQQLEACNEQKLNSSYSS